MRRTKTKLIGLDISSKIFNSYEDALKEANALKIYISRMINKENEKGNHYSAYVLIGVSENNSHFGKICLLKNGFRGRPKKVFLFTSKEAIKTNPHLHILIYGNPCDMIANRVSEHLKMKYSQHITWKKYCDSYPREAISYIFKQSKNVRTVRKNKYNLLDTEQFQGIIDEVNIQERINFTNSEIQEVANVIDSIDVFQKFKKLIMMVCNKPIPYLEKSIHTILNVPTSIIFLVILYSSFIHAP